MGNEVLFSQPNGIEINNHLAFALFKGLPRSFFRKNYLILFMTQCMAHCVQFLYKIFIFNSLLTQGVEILLALRSSCPYLTFIPVCVCNAPYIKK